MTAQLLGIKLDPEDMAGALRRIALAIENPATTKDIIDGIVIIQSFSDRRLRVSSFGDMDAKEELILVTLAQGQLTRDMLEPTDSEPE